MFKKICIMLLLCLLITSCQSTNSNSDISDTNKNSELINQADTDNSKSTNESDNQNNTDNSKNTSNENTDKSNPKNTAVDNKRKIEARKYDDFINSLSDSTREVFLFLRDECPESTVLHLSTPIHIDELANLKEHLATLRRNIHLTTNDEGLITDIESNPRTEFSDRLYQETVLFNKDTSYDRIVDEVTLLATNDDELYGYNRLDEEQKHLYDILAGETITEDMPYYFDTPQSFRKIKLVTSLYRSNNILLSWSNSYRNYFIITDENDKAIGIELKYGTHDKNNEMTDKFNKRVEEILAGFPKEFKDDKEKIKTIVYFMSDNVKYHLPTNYFVDPASHEANGEEICANLDNEYGAIVYGKCECYGFAYTFKFFADKLGLDCDIVYETKYVNDITVHRHCKNMIKLDGDYVFYEPQIAAWIESTSKDDYNDYFADAIESCTPRYLNQAIEKYSYSCDELYSDESNIFNLRYTKSKLK